MRKWIVFLTVLEWIITLPLALCGFVAHLVWYSIEFGWHTWFAGWMNAASDVYNHDKQSTLRGKDDPPQNF